MPVAPARERLAGEDMFWWSLDGPAHPMVMVALLRFARRPRRAASAALFDALVASHRRFRQRLVFVDGQGFWEDVPRVVRSRHWLRESLSESDGPDDEARLAAFVSRLASTPLDAERPLWQLSEVPLARGAAALIVRVHHVVGDGMAMLRVLLELSGREVAANDAAPTLQAKARSIDAAAAPAPEPAPADSMPAGSSSETAATLPDELRQRLMAAITPATPGQSAWVVLPALAADVAGLLTLADETPTPLKGALSGRRRVAASRPLPSAEVRRVARAFDCSSHELLVACLSGALAGWLRARGLDPSAIECRTQMPVNLRRDDERSELGNRFGVLTLALPLAPMNPAARAWELRRRLRVLQQGRHGELTRLMFTAVGLLAEPWRAQALAWLHGKASAVLSCMPGPPRARTIAGERVDELMFWVPQGAGIGVGLSIFNYDEAFRLGVMSDEALLPEPAEFLRAFEAEWERLAPLAAALQAVPRA